MHIQWYDARYKPSDPLTPTTLTGCLSSLFSLSRWNENINTPQVLWDDVDLDHAKNLVYDRIASEEESGNKLKYIQIDLEGSDWNLRISAEGNNETTVNKRIDRCAIVFDSLKREFPDQEIGFYAMEVGNIANANNPNGAAKWPAYDTDIDYLTNKYPFTHTDFLSPSLYLFYESGWGIETNETRQRCDAIEIEQALKFGKKIIPLVWPGRWHQHNRPTPEVEVPLNWGKRQLAQLQATGINEIAVWSEIDKNFNNHYWSRSGAEDRLASGNTSWLDIITGA